MKYLQIFTAIDNKSQAEEIACSLISSKSAGCVQIIGQIESIYKWKGKVEKAREYLLIIKTKDSLYKKVEKCIRSLHSYETPEIIAIPITGGSRRYLKWLEQAVK